MIQSNTKKNGESKVGIDSLPRIGLVQQEDLITMCKNQKEDKPTGERIPENLFQSEGESERGTMEKCKSQLQSSVEKRSN